MVYGVENTTCNPHPCIAGNTTDALFRGKFLFSSYETLNWVQYLK